MIISWRWQLETGTLEDAAQRTGAMPSYRAKGPVPSRCSLCLTSADKSHKGMWARLAASKFSHTKNLEISFMDFYGNFPFCWSHYMPAMWNVCPMGSNVSPPARESYFIQFLSSRPSKRPVNLRGHQTLLDAAPSHATISSEMLIPWFFILREVFQCGKIFLLIDTLSLDPVRVSGCNENRKKWETDSRGSFLCCHFLQAQNQLPVRLRSEAVISVACYSPYFGVSMSYNLILFLSTYHGLDHQ